MSSCKSNRLIAIIALTCLMIFYAGQLTAQPASPPAATDPKFLAKLMDMRQLLKQKRFQEVLKQSEDLLRSHPNTPELILLQVAAHQGLGNHSACQERAQYFLKTYPRSPNRDQVYFFLAASLNATNQKEEAAKAVEEARRITRDPEFLRQLNILEGHLTKDRRIGIRLGGLPPAGEDEKARAFRVARRILEITLKDYHALHGEYPASLAELTTSDPVILRYLPRNPYRPNETLDYKRENGSFLLEEGSLSPY